MPSVAWMIRSGAQLYQRMCLTTMTRVDRPRTWAASMKLFVLRNWILPAMREAIAGAPVIPTTSIT